MKRVMMTAAFCLIAGSAGATDLNVSATDLSGNSSITVQPGATVNYKVTGALSDTLNEGLALFGLDLDFEGGALAQADTPTQNPMLNFTRNAGITNPDGYGGTIINGDLVQVGGGQNTIKNFAENADFPIGTVITNVAHTAQVLVTGSLTAPNKPGTYRLLIKNVFANVIKDGETGNPFWATEAAGVGNVSHLTILVEGGGGCDGNEKFKSAACKCPGKRKLIAKGEATAGQTVQVSGDNGLGSGSDVANTRNKWKVVFKSTVTCGTTYALTATFDCGLTEGKSVTCDP
ncbi:MAG: hypothetical protein KJ057_00825 [Phycisphaerae bacterium]|nr:MAG: hypothetical protein F9K17_14865 [Phycisphaerae bacterium]MBE7455745.1 hypothetical protein [Planctomycetia bacterium]MCQ3919497.1 hypothetical protein [Planctomycetota bacterium]MCK6463381.1 hypothetical protein [Phycisphaerae bacterium]MCL4717003.1 hypothetical protein [Phycisphaerae bacterium]